MKEYTQEQYDEALIMYSTFNSLFKPPHTLNYLNTQFDINIDPWHFLRWLQEEDKYDTVMDHEVDIDKYSLSVMGECEFSCLYFAMLYRDRLWKGEEPMVISGNFGFWDHYWISYVYQKIEYFIDLTLQQFIKEAPMVAISYASNLPNGYNYYPKYNISITEYLNNKDALKFYVDPKEIS